MTGIGSNLPDIVALAAVGIASVTDGVSRRIPNNLTAPVALMGFLLQAWLEGWPGLVESLLGLVAGFLFFLPFYLARWMAAGDVKLLMAVGACLGWRLAILTGMSSLLIGALVALLFLLSRGGLWTYLARYWGMARCLLATGRVAYIPPRADEAASVRFPYAFAIALGTLAALHGPHYWSFMRIPILT